MPLYLDPKAISELFPAGPILGDELLVCVQDGATLKTTVDDVRSRVLCAWGVAAAFDPVADDTWETFSYISGPVNSKNVIDVVCTGYVECSIGSGAIIMRLFDNIAGAPIDGTVALCAATDGLIDRTCYGRGSISFYFEPDEGDVVYLSVQVMRKTLEPGTVFTAGGIASNDSIGDATVRIFRVG